MELSSISYNSTAIPLSSIYSDASQCLSLSVPLFWTRCKKKKKKHLSIHVFSISTSVSFCLFSFIPSYSHGLDVEMKSHLFNHLSHTPSLLFCSSHSLFTRSLPLFASPFPHPTFLPPSPTIWEPGYLFIFMRIYQSAHFSVLPRSAMKRVYVRVYCEAGEWVDDRSLTLIK